MEEKYRVLMLEQMDDKLNKYRSLTDLERPVKGWIHSIRRAIRMSGKQLSNRMGITPTRIYAIEKSEQDYSLTLKTMQQTAEALDCKFVYALVPKSSLKQMILDRAKKIAVKDVNSTSSTMNLENQGILNTEIERIIDETVQELVKKIPSRLWDEV